MANLIRCFILVFLGYFCVGISIAGNENMIPLPSNDPSDAQIGKSTGRLTHVKQGTVTYVPRNLLPQASQKVDEIDAANNATGYETVDDNFFSSKQKYYLSGRSEFSVINNLTSPLASVAKSELSKFNSLGVVPDGPTRKGPWSMVIRVFQRPDGTLVALREADYREGAIVVPTENINSTVGSIPAVFRMKSSLGGKTLSSISWVTPHKIFDLEVFDNVLSNTKYNKAWLIKLAEGVQ